MVTPDDQGAQRSTLKVKALVDFGVSGEAAVSVLGFNKPSDFWSLKPQWADNQGVNVCSLLSLPLDPGALRHSPSVSRLVASVEGRRGAWWWGAGE